MNSGKWHFQKPLRHSAPTRYVRSVREVLTCWLSIYWSMLYCFKIITYVFCGITYLELSLSKTYGGSHFKLPSFLTLSPHFWMLSAIKTNKQTKNSSNNKKTADIYWTLLSVSDVGMCTSNIFHKVGIIIILPYGLGN